jgi:hypothetical protein
VHSVYDVSFFLKPLDLLHSKKESAMQRKDMLPAQRSRLLIWLLGSLLYLAGCSNVDSVDYAPPGGSRETAITHFSYADIVVDGKTYAIDIFISADGTVQPWYLDPANTITPKHVLDLVAPSTRTIIIGDGTNRDSKPTRQTLDTIRDTGVTLYVSNTYNAVRLYNKTPKKNLAAFFHVGH